MFAVKKYLVVLCLLYAFCAQALASIQREHHIDIPRISGEINIDAKLDEPQWQQAKKVLVNNITRPYDNIPSPVNTEALLMEDGEVFYLAFIAQDPNPEQIRAYLKDRDRSWGDDIVGVKIDAYNDQRTAYRFMVNALGVQIDGIESEVTKKESDSWDGIWSSAGKVNTNGYIVEMALPLRMLNFKETDNLQTWAIELVRFYPWDERLRLSNITMDRANSCEICQMVPAQGFRGAKQGNNLTITPALVTGVSETRDEDSLEWQRDNNTEASLDIRWGITPDILLNTTINPDFSTVETDSAQLNINNTFALFFEEKRPFFLDNADYFDSNYNLVYTRNINAPDYGAKLTGRQDDHSFGIFLTDDTSTNLLIPGNRASAIAEIEGDSKSAALRYRYNYNPDITLGWISTLRSAQDYQNGVHGLDARFRLNTYDVFKFQTLYSNTQYPEDLYEQFCDSDNPEDCQAPQESDCEFGDCQYSETTLRTLNSDTFSGNAFRAGYYHNDESWYYRVTYDKQNAGFRGDLGFIPRIDHNKFSVGGDHKWYAEPGQWWNKFRIYSDWDITHNDNDELIEKEFDLSFHLSARYESYFRLSYSNRDKVGSRLDKSSLAIDGNTTLFTESQYALFAEFKPVAGIYFNTRMEIGDKIDISNNRLGDIKEIRPTFNWNVNQHLEFKLKQTYRQLDADNANVFIARLTDLRTTFQFNVQSFLRFSFIYNNTSRNPNNYLYEDPDDIDSHSKSVSTELLYAYKINPQTVFYLGYSDHHQAEEDFSELEQDERSLFMKFSYAWIR